MFSPTWEYEPKFTLLVLAIIDTVRLHFLSVMGTVAVVVVILLILIKKTKSGRYIWDKIKLKLPPMGVVVTKVAISRFTRTLDARQQRRSHLAGAGDCAGNRRQRHHRRRRQQGA